MQKGFLLTNSRKDSSSSSEEEPSDFPSVVLVISSSYVRTFEVINSIFNVQLSKFTLEVIWHAVPCTAPCFLEDSNSNILIG